MENIDNKVPTEDFLRSIDIHTILPQQVPFVMISHLTGYRNDSVISQTKIESDNIFVENGALTSCGLIENIAQTCAARIGYFNKYINMSDIIQIGYIGAVKNMEIIKLPSVGDTITTRITIIEEVFGTTMAEAIIECGDETIVKGEIKIALANDGTENS